MKVRINLDKNETIDVAEEKLEKALKTKKECSKGERYCDPILNEFHDRIEAQHKELLKTLEEEIKLELTRYLNGTF